VEPPSCPSIRVTLHSASQGRDLEVVNLGMEPRILDCEVSPMPCWAEPRKWSPCTRSPHAADQEHRVLEDRCP
jgi:hypothetical protein